MSVSQEILDIAESWMVSRDNITRAMRVGQRLHLDARNTSVNRGIARFAEAMDSRTAELVTLIEREWGFAFVSHLSLVVSTDRRTYDAWVRSVTDAPGWNPLIVEALSELIHNVDKILAIRSQEGRKP